MERSTRVFRGRHVPAMEKAAIEDQGGLHGDHEQQRNRHVYCHGVDAWCKELDATHHTLRRGSQCGGGVLLVRKRYPRGLVSYLVLSMHLSCVYVDPESTGGVVLRSGCFAHPNRKQGVGLLFPR